MIAWLDVETTGLDPTFGHLLEVGIILTDDELNELSRIDVVIQPPDGTTVTVDAHVRKMHEDSGLWDDCRLEGVELRDAEYILTRWLADRIDRENPPPVAGSTVSFDRAWVRYHMGVLDGFFHYRSIDVSTVKELNRRFKFAPEWDGGRKIHRSLPDIEDSIAELKLYLGGILG